MQEGRQVKDAGEQAVNQAKQAGKRVEMETETQ